MTCIVYDVKTKKELKDKVANGEPVRIEDPSITRPFTGMLSSYVAINGECVLTNHPRRSWFALVKMKDGDLVVE